MVRTGKYWEMRHLKATKHMWIQAPWHLSWNRIHRQKWELGQTKHSNIMAAVWPFMSANVKGRLGAVKRTLELLGQAAAVGKKGSCQGYDLKHVTTSAAAGQRNRFLQLQPASRTRVPLTHATVYWSGLRVVVFCSGALGAHTSHCQSVFCLNP